VPAASNVGYLTPDSGYASTIKCAPRAYRFFRNHYLCQRCPNEWADEALVCGPAFCPACDRATEPYDSIDLLEASA
jgi:hypothetical protein